MIAAKITALSAQSRTGNFVSGAATVLQHFVPTDLERACIAKLERLADKFCL